jgi:hypothetical protein
VLFSAWETIVIAWTIQSTLSGSIITHFRTIYMYTYTKVYTSMLPTRPCTQCSLSACQKQQKSEQFKTILQDNITRRYKYSYVNAYFTFSSSYPFINWGTKRWEWKVWVKITNILSEILCITFRLTLEQTLGCCVDIHWLCPSCSTIDFTKKVQAPRYWHIGISTLKRYQTPQD